MVPFHSFTLDPFETSLSCATLRLRYDSAVDGSTEATEFVVVGTCYIVPNEQEPSQGRLLVFQVDTDSEGTRVVTLVAEKDTRGPVYSLAEVRGKLVAGVNHKVQVFNLVRGESTLSAADVSMIVPSSELILDCVIAGQLMCLYLKSHGDMILVGDLLRSMTLLQYKPPAAGSSAGATTGQSGSVSGSLVEVSRHYSTDSLRSVEILPDSAEDVYLGADGDGNLYTTRRVLDAPTEEERGKMDPHGYFNLGDIVNVIKHGSLSGQLFETSAGASAAAGSASTKPTSMTSNPDDLMKVDSAADEAAVSAANKASSSTVLIGTVTGGLYSVIGIDQDSYTFFNTVERAVNSLTTGIGHFSHDDCRSFNNDRRSHAQRAFIDGDLVERILDLSSEELESIVRRVNDDLAGLAETASGTTTGTDTKAVYTVDDMLRKIEDMARQH